MQCLRLYYQGTDVTGCEVRQIVDQCNLENLPVCQTCSLCVDNLGLPGLIHNCGGYDGRNPSGPSLLDANECHSFQSAVLLRQGHLFPGIWYRLSLEIIVSSILGQIMQYYG